MESEAVMEEHRTPLGPLTPSQQNGEPAAPLDFSKLTSSQFGITTDSFTASPKHKDKSRVTQLKARRRSTIGVRGSPETNSLICFRAKQAMKTPPRTPQRLLESPLFSGCDSIKQKMAAFQRLMGTEEEEEEMRHTQFGVDCEERENRLIPVTPPLSKKRRRGTPHRVMWQEQIEEEETMSEITCSLEHEPQVDSSKSPGSMPSLGLNSQAQLLSLPMLSKPEMSKSGDAEVSSASKKKRVRFGAPLSPEFFDKTLPPSTPLQKGATPAPPPSSAGRKHSLLKTPQRFEPSLPQPDFNSPERACASPVLTASAPYDREAECDEVFLDNQKISFPIMDEEYDNPPQDTEAHESPDEHTNITSAASQEEQDAALPSSTAAPHYAAPPTAEEPVDQRRLSDTTDPSTEAPRARGRKRKQPAESETTETRRSSRSAAVSAKDKLKTPSSSKKKKFGGKAVDRSLYGKRDYASKNPLLSPIIESTASSLSSTLTPGHGDTSTPAINENPASDSVSAANQSETQTPNVTANLVAAAALWRRRFLHEDNNDKNPDTKLTDSSEHSDVQSETPVASPDKSACKHVNISKGRRNSASRRRSGEPAVGENVFCPSESQESNQEKEPAGEPSAAEKSKRRKSLQKSTERGRRSARTKTSSVSKQEERIEEQGEAEEVCRDTVESSGSEREAVKKSDDVRQNQGPEEHTKNHEESTPPSPPSEALEPWQQQDFCIEEVLKPLTKTRSSVRRSLRNRRSVDALAKGLAWVEHTSPQTITTTQRRRTRGRLSAVSQPPSLPDPEEPSGEQALTVAQC